MKHLCIAGQDNRTRVKGKRIRREEIMRGEGNGRRQTSVAGKGKGEIGRKIERMARKWGVEEGENGKGGKGKLREGREEREERREERRKERK